MSRKKRIRKSPSSGPKGKRPKTALIFCGGGITGFVYELGAIIATEELLGEGFTCNDFDIFIGISAGASLATLMALGVSPRQIYDSIVDDKNYFFNPERDDIFDFSLKGPKHSVLQLAKLASLFYKKTLRGKGMKFIKTPGLFSEMMPDGFFNMENYVRYWNKFLKKNRFPKNVDDVGEKLYIVATHLDSARRCIFGQGHIEGVSIGQAIVASSAVPGFLEPVRINDEDYIDGVASDVAPIDIAVDQGAQIVLIYNPMVPILNDTKEVCVPSVLGECAHLRDKGFIKIFDQAMRAQIHARLHVRLKEAQKRYPDVTFLLVEPRKTETLIFLHSPMEFEVRKEILHLGIDSARKLAKKYADRVQKAFAKNNIPLNQDFFRG